MTITASDSDGKSLTSDTATSEPWDLTSVSAAERVTFTFTVSEPIDGTELSGFGAADLLVTRCAGVTDDTQAAPSDSSAFSGSGMVYYVVCDAAAAETISVAVPAQAGTDGFQDVAGNGNAGSTPTRFYVRSDPRSTGSPTVSITAVDGADAALVRGAQQNAAFTFTATASELTTGSATEFGQAMLVVTDQAGSTVSCSTTTPTTAGERRDDSV